MGCHNDSDEESDKSDRQNLKTLTDCNTKRMEERCSLNSSIWDSSTEGATHTYLTLFKIGFRANPSECGLICYLLLYWHGVTPITAGIYGNIQKKLFQEVSRRVQG